MREQDINRFWRKIINTMSEGLVVIGSDGTIITVNQTFEQLTGWASKEVVGKSCTLLDCDACETTLTRTEDAWCTLFQDGRDVSRRCLIRKKDGGYLSVLKKASVLVDDQGERLGAVETLTNLSEVDRLDSEIDHLYRHFEETGGFHGIVGKSSAIQHVFDVIRKAAVSAAPVVIFGESGTGKELVARAIHQLGIRKHGPFIQLNCAALNESLLESELFGHVKGAFTGAHQHRIGRFEAAHGGDFFLDEIGDIPLSIQVKLLRVLETKKFERVGDHQPISTDVRIITATNKNLDTLMYEKKFREDLFFRINVIPIHLPPLRDRSEDIPLLMSTFIQRLQERTGKKIVGLTPTAMEYVTVYPWPGNVRELKSALAYAFVIAEKGLIALDQLPPQISGYFEKHQNQAVSDPLPFHGAQGPEKDALIDALRKSRGNQSQAARLLGINRVTVWHRMKKYGIDLKKVISAQDR